MVYYNKTKLKNQPFYGFFDFKNTATVAVFLFYRLFNSRIKLNLGKLIPKLKPGDMLITTEISCLARSLMELKGILQTCLEKECQVWTLKEKFRLGTDVQSKVLAFAFGLSAELSKSLLQARVRESLARLKADGKKLGRPFGSKSRELKL